MNVIRYVLFIVAILLLFTACQNDESKEPPIAPFMFTNQHGEPFGTDELDGEIWIANFFFTNCSTVCPILTTEMAKLQQTFKEQDLDVTLVSFTVDPINDSVEVLQRYIAMNTDDNTNWFFLTGYTQDEIERFAREQFQTIVQKPKDSNQVIHGSNIYLIDQKGRIVKEFHYSDDAYVKEMIDLVKKIQ